MIEIQAKLLRGPVYFVNETIQCLITLKNVPRPENVEISSSSSSSSNVPNGDIKSPKSNEPMERVCWANVQLHCFCSVDESQIDCRQIIEKNLDSELINHNGLLKGKRNSIALETYTSNDTSFHESLIRGERGIIIYASKPKILFCDLQLEPHQSQTYIYTETLPSNLNPSYSSSRLKYYYKLSIGAQRIGSPINLLKIPIRILTVEGFPPDQQCEQSLSNKNKCDTILEDDEPSPTDETINSTNSSFTPTFDDETKDYGTSLDMALHRIEYLVGHRRPHSFNITSSFGKVARFFIFKTVYRLGEDIVGLFDFTDGVVKCVRYSVKLQSEEKIEESFCNTKSSNSSKANITNHNECQECCLDLTHSPMVLTVPFTVTPSFSNDLISLKWNLHFSFLLHNNHNQQQPPSKVVNIQSENEDGIQTLGPRRLNVQTMTWDFPIQIVATYPAYVAKGFQMASIGILNI